MNNPKQDELNRMAMCTTRGLIEAVLHRFAENLGPDFAAPETPDSLRKLEKSIQQGAEFVDRLENSFQVNPQGTHCRFTLHYPGTDLDFDFEGKLVVNSLPSSE